MRTFLSFALVAGLLSGGSAGAAQDAELAAFVEESRAAVKAFAEELGGALKAAIEEGGPAHAIPVCNAKAPEIAARLSEAKKLRVARTSHRVRNPGNAPDAWERAVLAAFQQRAAAGQSLQTMEKAERVEGGTLRYMKAIPTGELCLTCHGADIEPALKTQIEAFYPDDEATGFALGELRGAFTISRDAAAR